MDRSDAMLLGFTILFQLISFLTLLRVATGVAAITQPNPNLPTIVIPTSLNQSIGIPASTPQFQNPVGNGLNSSFLLAALFVIANVIVISMLAYLYRKRKMKWFSVVISLFLIFNVTELYFTFLLGLSSIIPIVAAILASLAAIACAVYGMKRLVNFLALILALELGCSFPVLLQAPLNWIVPAVYAVFDIYAIYYGRLGKLVRQVAIEDSKPKESSERVSAKPKRFGLARWPDFGLMTINFDRIEIGMADIAFYTMVPAVALILVNLLGFIVVMVVVELGIIFSFYVFRNREVSPGLPVPILLGLAALLVMHLLT